MRYNFDEIIFRTNTDCEKYDGRTGYFGSIQVLPMWVADMDFKTPDFIIEAIKKRADHGILGYTFHSQGFYESIINWMKNKHNWNIKKEWILHVPGIVPALNLAIQAYSEPGDKIVIQPPVYFPFFSSIRNNERQLVVNPLKYSEGRYHMDLDDLEEKIDSKTKMIFLCNPHNPAGISWTKNEIDQLARICLKHKLIIISDEIHSDLILKGYKHTPTATLSDEIANITVTLMAPSKTFNTAGLACSEAIIPNPELYRKFKRSIDNVHVGMGNLFGSIALEAAYKQGDEWLTQLLDYLQANVDFTLDYFAKNIPRIKAMKPEATYLIWLDCRLLGMNNKSLKEFFIFKAKVGLNNGPDFGKEGEGFQRINIACPRSIIEEGLKRIETAVNSL
jgi:cystathionine beta-lyase